MDCGYCKVSKKAINFLHESPYWKIILAQDQAYLGRSVFVLSRHCGSLAELTKEEQLDLFEIINKFENSLKNTFGAAMFNYSCLMNNAYQKDAPNPHLHWHVRPRYDYKVLFEGITFEDAEFGHHYNRESRKPVSAVTLEKIAERIKQNL